MSLWLLPSLTRKELHLRHLPSYWWHEQQYLWNDFPSDDKCNHSESVREKAGTWIMSRMPHEHHILDTINMQKFSNLTVPAHFTWLKPIVLHDKLGPNSNHGHQFNIEMAGGNIWWKLLAYMWCNYYKVFMEVGDGLV